MSVTVAIHQPNFLPWLGFFNKVSKSDKFVLLDNVQFPKTGGGWTNRTYLIINSEKKWVTIPIKRNFSGTKQINEIKINNDFNWKKNFLKKIEFNYKKHPFFREYFFDIEEIISRKYDFLIDLNLNFIKYFFKILNFDEKNIFLASEFKLSSRSSKLLVDLTICLNGSVYLSGNGASDYLDQKVFDRNNLKVKYQSYNPPNYSQYQSKKFINGISILDCLMNIGHEETKKIINKH